MPSSEYWRQQAEMLRRIARSSHRRHRRHAIRQVPARFRDRHAQTPTRRVTDPDFARGH